jgi:hypothetical protein
MTQGASGEALRELHDVVVPSQVSLMPATVAWGVVLATLLLAAAYWGWRWWRRWQRDSYRRDALGELSAIEARLGSSETRAAALAALPTLAKRVALCASPRAEIASLSGEAWLSALDTSWPGTGFAEGAGRLLPTLAYAPGAELAALTDAEIAQCVTLLREWIVRHHGVGQQGGAQ